MTTVMIMGIVSPTSPVISINVITTAIMVRVQAPNCEPAPMRAYTPGDEIQSLGKTNWAISPTILPNKLPNNKFGTNVPHGTAKPITPSVKGT